MTNLEIVLTVIGNEEWLVYQPVLSCQFYWYGKKPVGSRSTVTVNNCLRAYTIKNDGRISHRLQLAFTISYDPGRTRTLVNDRIRRLLHRVLCAWKREEGSQPSLYVHVLSLSVLVTVLSSFVYSLSSFNRSLLWPGSIVNIGRAYIDLTRMRKRRLHIYAIFSSFHSFPIHCSQLKQWRRF